MDKETIIKRIVASLVPTYNLTIADCQQIVFPAMDEYAKLHSIAFAEWMNEQDCQMTTDGWVRRPLYDAEFITIDQLYSLYKEQTK